jgi:ATP-dependent Clp protease protease subunit
MMKNTLIPYVIEKNSDGERSYDLFSRLLKDRIVMISGEITDQSMDVAVAELLFLNSQDPNLPIYLYINSPGGSVVAGNQLIDTMNFISAPVWTIALGMAASMGGAILSAGEKGHRYCLKSSQILVHPMSGGTGSARTRDNIISMNYERKLENYLIANIAYNCGRISKDTKEEIEAVVGKANIKDSNMVIKFSKTTEKELEEFKKDYDYDHWMFAEEALQFGIVDKVLNSESEMFE